MIRASAPQVAPIPSQTPADAPASRTNRRLQPTSITVEGPPALNASPATATTLHGPASAVTAPSPAFTTVFLGSAALAGMTFAAVNFAARESGLQAAPLIAGLTMPALLGTLTGMHATTHVHSRNSLRRLLVLGLAATGMLTLCSAFLSTPGVFNWIPGTLCFGCAADQLLRAMHIRDPLDSPDIHR